MSPHTARFSAFDDLAATARDGGPGLARAMLKVQTELFVQNAVDRGAEFLPLALTLIPMVDETTAREVAQKLCPLPQVPAAVIEALFARGGGVAETVVGHVADLPDHLRQAALEHGDPRVPARLAARSDLDEAEQLHLAGRGSPALSLALAQNTAIKLSRPVVAALIGSARHDAALAHAVLARGDVDTVALTPLYLSADLSQRAHIRHEIERRIAVRSFTMPHREANEGEKTRLMEAALHGMSALIADLAVVTGRDSAFAGAAERDASREIVALALVGLGLIPEDTTRILLRTGDGVARDSRALHALVDIVRKTSRLGAEMIIGANWPQSGVRGGTQHVPAMAPGGNTSRPGQGTTRKPGSQQIIDQVRSRS